MEYIKLYNGVEMPQLGYGVYQVSPEECERCVSDALSVGYRMIDTAQAYQNEEGVGYAWRKSGVKREDLFLVSKIWISNYGYEKAKASIDESLRKLQTEYIDLMLLHQPFCDRYGAYRALIEAYREGKLRAIGVSNFYPDHFIDLASKHMCSVSRNRLRNIWRSSDAKSCRGGRWPRAETVSSPTKCSLKSAKLTARAWHKQLCASCCNGA